MNLKDQLKDDINGFFTQIETLSNYNKKETLKNLIDKYVHLNSSDTSLNKEDFKTIIEGAKRNYHTLDCPSYIGDGFESRVENDDFPKLCLIESTISHLNSLECFKKLPKFKYNK